MSRKGALARQLPAEGERLEVSIVDLNHDGEGVAKTADGFVLFVPGALPGDRAVVEVRRVRARYGEAEIVRLVAPAAHRIQPACPVAGECGGCALQPLAYPAELAWKEERVRQALVRVGRLANVPVKPILGMNRPYAYRNKAQYPVRKSDGKTVVGFYRRKSHEVVAAGDCLIQHPLAVKVAEVAKELIDDMGLAVYDETSHQGFVRHLVVRVSFSREECMAILVTRERHFPEADTWVEAMRRRVPEIVSLVQNVNPRQGNVILGDESIVLWGAHHLIESIGHREFLISPTSFFQVNPVQAKELYEVVRQDAAVRPGDVVWDVYCGAGTIGIYVATEGVRLRGVEKVAAAVEDAWRNARLNGIDDAHFEQGDAETALPKWVARGERADVAILDPPRSGSDPKTLSAIAKAAPRKIVYVSCNPATLARDLAYLATQGYRTIKVQPVDMFPRTPHVEAVALLLPISG